MKISLFISSLIHIIVIGGMIYFIRFPEPKEKPIPIKIRVFKPIELVEKPLPMKIQEVAKATMSDKKEVAITPKYAEQPALKSTGNSIPAQMKKENPIKEKVISKSIASPVSSEELIAKLKVDKEAKIQKEAELKMKMEAERKVRAEVEAKSRADAKAKAEEQARLSGIRNAYIGSIKNAVEKNKKYPQLSKARGEEGSVVLKFRIHQDGKISDIGLQSSSSFEKLDEAAIKAVEKLGVFNAIPKDLEEEYMDISIPMKFKLS